MTTIGDRWWARVAVCPTASFDALLMAGGCGGTVRAHLRRALLCVAIVSVALAAAPAQAALLLTDDFTGYTVSGNLNGQTGGSPSGIWTKGGSGPSCTIANATALTYSGYNGGSGNYVAMPTPSSTASRTYKGFTTTASVGNTFYFSFLLRLSAATATGDYFISLGDPTSGTTYGARLFAKTSGAGFVLGISKAGTSANYGSTVLSFNTTYLIVARFSGVTGSANDLAYVWVNPSLASEPTTGSAEASDTSSSDPGFSGGNVGNFHWHNRSTSNPSGAFDALRLAAASSSATAWSDLAAAATTPSIALADNGTQVGAANVNAGATSAILHKFQLSVTVANATLNGVSFTSAGTYAASDISNFKVWYNTSSSFGGATQLGSTITTGLGTGSHGVSGLTQAINSGNTGYIFITADIAGSPAAGNTINVNAITTADISVAAGTTSGSTAAGGSQTIITLPTVASPTVSSIDQTSATLGANVTSLGGTTISARGTVWGTSASPTGNASPEGGTATGAFTHSRTGLSSGTLYYYRGYAVNTVGAAYSSDGTFYTEPGQVSGVVVDNITGSGMRVSWSAGSSSDGAIVVVRDGNASVTDPSDGAEHAANSTFGSGADLGGTGSYAVYRGSGTTVTIGGMTAGHTYYVEVFAYKGSGAGSSSSSGINYRQASPGTGSGATLSTSVPVLSAPTATSVTADGATLGATIDSDGNSTITSRGTVWGAAAAPTGNGLAEGGTSVSAFSHARTGLSPGTFYYYRGYAVNGVGTGYSPDGTFWTIPAAPGVSAASSLAVSSFSANWSAATGATNYVLDAASDSGFTSFVSGFQDRPVGNVTTHSVTGLSPNVTYYYRLRAQDAGGTSTNSAAMSATTSIDTAGVSTVAGSATNTTTATVGGNVASAGGGTVTNRGVCYKTSAGVTIADNKTPSGSGTGSFTANLSSLAVNTRHYFRAYADNDAGSSLGAELDFWTWANVPSAPTVANPSASTLDVTVNANGNPGATLFSIQSTNNSFFVQTNGTLGATEHWRTAASWSAITVTGLGPNSNYSFQVRAQNGAGVPTAWSSIASGTTLAQLPSVTTTVANPTNATTAAAGGNVTADGGAAVTNRGVVWSLSPTPVVPGSQTTNGTGTGSFSSTLTNLTAGSVYYYRAFAQNSAGTAYGAELSLTAACFGGVVTGLVVSATNDVDFTLVWSNFTGARGYQLDVSSSPSFAGSGGGPSNLLFQGFESAAADTWVITGGSAQVSTQAGSSDFPPSQRIHSGTKSWLVNSENATLYLSNQTLQGYSSCTVEVWVSSTSGSSGNGADASDYVRIYVATNGGPYPATPDIELLGNSNARWGFWATNYLVATAGAPRSVSATAGTSSNNYALAMIQLPASATSVSLRVSALNSDANEFWNIDDVRVVGTGVAVPGFIDGYSNRAVAATSQAVTGLVAGGTYYARVRATNLDCVTKNSYTVSVTTVTGPSPGIAVLGNGLAITNGDTSPAGADFTDFGNVGYIASNLVRTFTITNSGLASLGVGNVAVSGAHATNFIVSGQPSSPVAGGGTTTFQVRFDPSAPGLRTATLQFTNNVDGSSPFNFSVQGTGVGAGIAAGPASIAVTGMVGSAIAPANLGITNAGLGQLAYTLSTNANWLAVSPASGALSESESQQHAVSFSAGGFAAAMSNGTITITDANASNSPQTVAVSLTLTNIPEVLSASATADGMELVRLSWTKSPDFNVLIVHRATNAPAAPSNATAYAPGDPVGANGSRVIYSGAGAYLDHVVRPGSTNYYAFYSINNSHYATGTVVMGVVTNYRANERVEPFGYTNGVSLNGLNGGSLFTSAWAVGAGNFTVLSNGPAPNLSVNTNYPASKGQRVVVSNYVNDAEMRASRNFAAITNGTLYVSYLVAVEYGGAGKYTGVRLLSNGVERVFAGETGDNDVLGIDGHGGSPVNSGFGLSSFQSNTGNVYLVVARYIFSSNQVAVKGYYRTDTVPEAEPSAWDATATASADRTFVNGIELVSGGFGGNQPGLVSFDEVRVATTWSGLIPVSGTPEFSVSPTNITVSVMRGSNPADATFAVTNSGGGVLTYSVGTNRSWVTVTPTSGNLSPGPGQAHAVKLTTAALAVGTNTATVTVTDANAINSPAQVSISVAVTNIPPPTNISSRADGNELVRLGWSVGDGLESLVLHGNVDIVTDPSQGVSYTNGDALGLATVVYRGTNTTLEHVVPPGSTNYYAFYAVNSNYYSHFGTNVVVVDCPDATATNLKAGDVAVYGMMTHTSGTTNNDSFAFVTLADLPAGTQIKFTDNGWAASNAFRGSEGVITWTATNCTPAGTAIQWIFTNVPQVTRGTVTSNDTFALNVNAEQILAYQGPETNPVFLYALSSHPDGAWQNDATNSNSSRLPPGLTNGYTAVVIQGLDNIVLNTNGLEIAGDRDVVLSYIGDPGHWTGDDTVVFDLLGFNFTFPDLNTSGGGVMTNVVMGLYGTNELVDVFAYTNSLSLSAPVRAGGQGWTQGWGGVVGAWTLLSNDHAEVSFPTMSLYPSNAANVAKLSNPGSDATGKIARGFAPITNGSVYAAAMVAYQYEGFRKFAGLSLLSGGAETAFVGKVSDNAYNFTLGIDAYGGAKKYANYDLRGLENSTNNTYLLVVRYDFDTKEIRGQAYYRGVSVPSNEPAYWAVTATVSGAGIPLIDGIRLSAGADNGGMIGNAYFDEVRVATTWGLLINGRAPTVETRPVTNIQITTAAGGGDVLSDGSLGVTNRGVLWSTNALPTLADSRSADGLGPGLYSSALTNLVAGQTYYVRAYAQNSGGTGYGAVSNFTANCFTSAVINLHADPTNDFDFTAAWSALAGAAGYQLDVSTNALFATGTAEDFDDGDFTSGPAWSGDTALYAIDTSATLPGGSAATDAKFLASASTIGNSALLTPSTETASWSFSLGSPNFDPSSANYIGVVLMSDAAFSGDVTTNLWNGYYLKLGVDGATDYLELWRSTGAAKTKVGDFSAAGNFGTGALQNGLNLRITRNGSGVFSLQHAMGFTYSAAPSGAGGSLTDATYSASSYFGVFTRLGSPGTSRRVYLDNLVLSGNSSYVPGYSGRPVAGTSLSVTGLQEGVAYYFVLRAVGGGACASANSATGMVITRDFHGPSSTNFAVNGVTNITDFQLAGAITVTATAVDTGGVNWNGANITPPDITPSFSVYDALGAQIVAPHAFDSAGHADGESPSVLTSVVTVATVTTGSGFRAEITMADHSMTNTSVRTNFFNVVDDDATPPTTASADFSYGGVGSRYFAVTTNASPVLVGNRAGTFSNTLYTLTDADLNEANARDMRFAFGLRDAASGIARGAAGTTNTVMSFSVGGIISGNFTNYRSDLSSANYTNARTTNVWSFPAGFFTETIITSLMANASNVVSVTAPDDDADRANDQALLVANAVGAIAVVDDDATAPSLGGLSIGSGTITNALTVGGGLIIAQYYEGTSNDKWIELYNASANTLDLSAGGYRVGLWANSGREGWKTSVAPDQSVALSGSLAPGATYVLKNGSASNPSYATAQQTNSLVINFNGDDSVVVYLGGAYNFTGVVDAIGFTDSSGQDVSYVRASSITTGSNGDYSAGSWTTYTLAQVDSASAGTVPYIGYHATAGTALTMLTDGDIVSGTYAITSFAQDAYSGLAVSNAFAPYFTLYNTNGAAVSSGLFLTAFTNGAMGAQSLTAVPGPVISTNLVTLGTNTFRASAWDADNDRSNDRALGTSAALPFFVVDDDLVGPTLPGTIASDPFTDGTRLDGADGEDLNWWPQTSGAVAGVVNDQEGIGSGLALSFSGTNQGILVGRLTNTLTLANDYDQIVLTYDMRVASSVSHSNNCTVGLYYDSGTSATGDLHAGSTDDDVGYFGRCGTGTNTGLSIYRENGTNSTLLSGSDSQWLASEPSCDMGRGGSHSMEFRLMRRGTAICYEIRMNGMTMLAGADSSSPMRTNINEIVFGFVTNCSCRIDNVALAKSTVTVTPSSWTNDPSFLVQWTTNNAFDPSGISEFRYTRDGAVPMAVTDGVPADASSQTYMTITNEGLVTNFIFAVDADGDRPDDRTRGAYAEIQTRLDRTPPPRVTGFFATNGPDDTAEIQLSWTGFCANAGNRASDGEVLSPWRTYAIFFTDQPTGPTTNDSCVTYANGPLSLRTNVTTGVIASNFISGADYRVAVAGIDEAGNIGPLSDTALVSVANFVVTQGLVSAVASNRVELSWTAKTNDAGDVTRSFDSIYFDSAAGFANSSTGQWQLLQRVTNSWAYDTGSVIRTPPYQLTNSLRFYRAAVYDAWRPTNAIRRASQQIYVSRAFKLVPGENWLSLFAMPDTNTVAGVFGTNRLPRSGVIPNATRITWYGGGTSNGQPKTTVYLSASNRWIYSLGGAGIADQMPVPLGEGFNIELPAGASAQNLLIIGQLPTNSIKVPVVAGTNFNILSCTLPRRMKVGELGLVEAGFLAGTNPLAVVQSADELRILNNSGGNGSMTSPRLAVWAQKIGSGAPTYCKSGGFTSANNEYIEVDETIIWYRRGSRNTTWTNDPLRFYSVPGKTMNP